MIFQNFISAAVVFTDEIHTFRRVIGTPGPGEWPPEVSLPLTSFKVRAPTPLEHVIPDLCREGRDLLSVSFHFFTVRFVLTLRLSVKETVDLCVSRIKAKLISIFQKILVFSPTQRLTSGELLDHPYFDDSSYMLPSFMGSQESINLDHSGSRELILS